MPHTLEPGLIDQATFTFYTSQWKQLINDNNADLLRECFKVNGAERLNYVFLPNALAKRLLSAAGTESIRTKFALVPRAGGGAPVFTVIFYGTDSNEQPTSAYYLAGVADLAAEIDDSNFTNKDSTIPYGLASAWLHNWDTQPTNDFDFPLFTTAQGRLRGYTYELQDFLGAINPPASGAPAAPALWLNFAAHEYDEPGSTSTDNPSKLFGMVLTLNEVPAAGVRGTITLSSELRYYDIANPCPPACGLNDSNS